MTVLVDVSRVLATCSSLVMLFSPVPSLVRANKAKSTGYMSIVPLVAMLTNFHVLMMFGYLTKKYFPIFTTFVTGDIVSLFYVAVFYYYSNEKSKAHRVFLLFGIPYVGLSIYALLGGFGVTHQTRHQAGEIISYFSVLTGLVVFSSPLEKVRPVLKYKSAVFFNIQMIYAGTICNIMWVFYCALTDNWIILATNSFSAISGCFQIALYWIYHPSTHPAPELPVVTPHDVEMTSDKNEPRPPMVSDTDTSCESPYYFVTIESPRVLESPV